MVFLEFDQHLLAPRFGAGEEAFALLARAARVVGTHAGGGRVLVQTRVPTHEVLMAATRADPDLVTAAELPVRRQLGLPPFGALALLRGPVAATYADGLTQVAGLEVSGIEADDFMGRMFQHEVDHLDGVLMVERLDDDMRKQALKILRDRAMGLDTTALEAKLVSTGAERSV